MDEATGEVEPTPNAPSIVVHLRGDSQAMLAVTGELDEMAVARLTHVVTGVCAAGARFLIFDLSGTTRCGDAVRPFLTKLRRRLQLGQGWLMLLEPPAELSDVDQVSLEEAFAAYRWSAVAAVPPQTPPHAPPPAPEVA
ncbi:MAG: STAS domain-containing protein [Gemmatimonadales bacterium]